MTDPTAGAVLHAPMQPNDTDAARVVDYLVALLRTLWREGEGFSGKRPFGTSGWKTDLYRALGDAGMVDIAYDEHGYIETVDSEKADRLIAAAIEALR